MRQITVSGQPDTRYPIAETLWIPVGIIMFLAIGDALILLGLAFVIVAMTTAWWTYHKVEHRGERNDAIADSRIPLCRTLEHSMKVAASTVDKEPTVANG